MRIYMEKIVSIYFGQNVSVYMWGGQGLVAVDPKHISKSTGFEQG